MTSAVAAPLPPLGYDPTALPRELSRHYVSATEADLAAMLDQIGLKRLDELYDHVAPGVRMAHPLPLPEELSYAEAQQHVFALSQRNVVRESYLGDGLPDYQVQPIVPYVSSLRKLTTAYTPYQPERSQGTLMTHWIYQSALSMLTGFEAINSSLYDRSTALYEAIVVAIRLRKKADTALLSEGLFPGDLEVLRTLVADTELKLRLVPLDPSTGRTSLPALQAAVAELGDRLAAVAFPQVNSLGLLEDVDALTLAARATGAKTVAVVDPLLLATGGLKSPVTYGGVGVDMIVGEAQHLAIGPNFGGPGLGLFGIRFTDKNPNDIRQTPGRFVGKAYDLAGRECRVMVLSTREQHIRKDKATSNICSNQAFLATLAGAALLARGDAGLAEACAQGHQQATAAAAALTAIPGVSLAFPATPFWNEVTLAVPRAVEDILAEGRLENLHAGVDVSGRVAGGRYLLKLSFSDQPRDLGKLVAFFQRAVGHKAGAQPGSVAPVPAALRRTDVVGLPQIPDADLRRYYTALAELNMSPDTACYPLGSCTMKYNPYLNDWAASLPGFTGLHPQAPIEDSQGSLELLYQIQEWFKGITGLAGVTTQPVAGAQGELVGIKMFQAYHRDRGEGSTRDVILIPKSSHGTNFATAAMAGYTTRVVNGLTVGIVYLEGDATGQVDMTDFDAKLSQYGRRIAGVMITNPNTSGIFETRFHEIAEKIHALGGLVYMDGANMNAIAGWVDLGKLGVDAVHNNLHKTWTIPHGGGGPGDGMVAVSHRLVDYLPGYQVVRDGHLFRPVRAPKSIGSFHRHWGNFAHKVRAYTYLLRLGAVGVPRVMAVAVLASRYLFARLGQKTPTLPAGAVEEPRMHEFILTLAEEDFQRLEKAGVPRAAVIPRVGKLFLDFGFHAPTVAWPEQYGLMIEPTESYSKSELDRFAEAVEAILHIVREHPEVLTRVPHFTPVERVDDVTANRNLVLFEKLAGLPTIHPNRFDADKLHDLPVAEVVARIVAGGMTTAIPA